MSLGHLKLSLTCHFIIDPLTSVYTRISKKVSSLTIFLTVFKISKIVRTIAPKLKTVPLMRQRVHLLFDVIVSQCCHDVKFGPGTKNTEISFHIEMPNSRINFLFPVILIFYGFSEHANT